MTTKGCGCDAGEVTMPPAVSGGEVELSGLRTGFMRGRELCGFK
jgi:hypothetical protein